MAGFIQRLESQFYTASWQLPVQGLCYGLGGAVYANFTKLPLEKAAIAYTIWGIADAALRNLAMLLTDDQKKRTMLGVGVRSICCMVAITKLTQMKLMGIVCALVVAFFHANWNMRQLIEQGVVTL